MNSCSSVIFILGENSKYHLLYRRCSLPVILVNDRFSPFYFYWYILNFWTLRSRFSCNDRKLSQYISFPFNSCEYIIWLVNTVIWYWYSWNEYKIIFSDWLQEYVLSAYIQSFFSIFGALVVSSFVSWGESKGNHDPF